MFWLGAVPRYPSAKSVQFRPTAGNHGIAVLGAPEPLSSSKHDAQKVANEAKGIEALTNRRCRCPGGERRSRTSRRGGCCGTEWRRAVRRWQDAKDRPRWHDKDQSHKRQERAVNDQCASHQSMQQLTIRPACHATRHTRCPRTQRIAGGPAERTGCAQGR